MKSEKIVMVMIKSVITLIQIAFVEVTHFDIIGMELTPSCE